MSSVSFEKSVFINCPFDKEYAPLMEATLFCVVYFGFQPRLASESVEAGENRLDKIVKIIRCSKYSIHDLSRAVADAKGAFQRMNMPFELGIDVGFRRSGETPLSQKKFLIFEKTQYDVKRALSDISGQDVEYHKDDFQLVIKHVRNFFRVEANIETPGAQRIVSDYATFQGWMIEKKIYEGHSEADAISLPTRERLDEMKCWIGIGKPSIFDAPMT